MKHLVLIIFSIKTWKLNVCIKSHIIFNKNTLHLETVIKHVMKVKSCLILKWDVLYHSYCSCL